MDPTNKTLAVTIGGKRYHLYFDLNTFAAFEEATGKFFLDFLTSIQEPLAEAQKQGDPMLLMRRISLKDVRALIWAACHTYDKRDEPQWPMTIGQLSKQIDVASMSTLLPKLISGVSDNSPDREETDGEGSRPPDPAEENEDSPRAGGGEGSGVSDESLLASLTLKSDG